MAETAPQRDAVLDALERLLAWPEMMRSPQLAKFLSYIVHQTLDGQEQAIKAYSIAVDVFGRSADFDPQSDPIVRVQARRLRTLLTNYYDANSSEPLHIRLPTGRYVPEFVVFRSETSAPEASAVPPPKKIWKWQWPIVLGLLLVLAPLVYFSTLRIGSNQAFAPALEIPQITIVEFSGPPESEADAPMVAGLAIELVTDLEQFGSIDVRYGGTRPAPETVDQAHSFVLTGAAQPDGELVSYVATLTRPGSDVPLWSKTISVPRAEATRPTILDDLARSFSMVLGSSRGPLHVLAREQAAAGHLPLGSATLYSCRVLFHLYRDRGAREDAARVERCIADLPEEDRVSASALAMGASLAVDFIDASADESTRAQIYQRALNDLDLALEASPVSSFVWEQRARLEETRGDFATARSFYNSALQLNPANNNGMAAFGRLLAFQGAMGEERPLALEALAGSPDPPPWYHGGPAALALLDGDFALALSHAEIYAAADPDLGFVLAVVAAQAAGRSAAVERFLPRVLGSSAFRAAGILPQLQTPLGDPHLLKIIRDGLLAAGVPATALDQSF